MNIMEAVVVVSDYLNSENSKIPTSGEEFNEYVVRQFHQRIKLYEAWGVILDVLINSEEVKKLESESL
jgi:hypothetical protein